MRLFTLAVLLGLFSGSLMLTACNTVRGMGEDLEEASNDVEDAMQDAGD